MNKSEKSGNTFLMGGLRVMDAVVGIHVTEVKGEIQLRCGGEEPEK
jgi:hypothetical protein